MARRKKKAGPADVDVTAEEQSAATNEDGDIVLTLTPNEESLANDDLSHVPGDGATADAAPQPPPVPEPTPVTRCAKCGGACVAERAGVSCDEIFHVSYFKREIVITTVDARVIRLER